MEEVGTRTDLLIVSNEFKAKVKAYKIGRAHV